MLRGALHLNARLAASPPRSSLYVYGHSANSGGNARCGDCVRTERDFADSRRISVVRCEDRSDRLLRVRRSSRRSAWKQDTLLWRRCGFHPQQDRIAAKSAKDADCGSQPGRELASLDPAQMGPLDTRDLILVDASCAAHGTNGGAEASATVHFAARGQRNLY